MAAAAAAKQTLITLRSSDLEEFQVSEPVAAVSLTIKRMLEDELPAGSVIPLLNVDGKTLDSVISYMKAHASGDEQKEFDAEFIADKEIGVLLVTIKAADYLNIPGLFGLLARTIAARIEDKPVEYVRNVFGQKNDYTAEEEDEIRSQNHWVFDDNTTLETETAATTPIE